MTVGERIKEYVTEHGIKQSFLAEKAGVDGSKMSKILNGSRDIGLYEYYNVCQALNVPMETFVKE